MKNYFWIIFLCAAFCINTNGFAQDTIKTKSGDKIAAKLLKLTRKEATYKTYQDPEFSTYTIPYKELSSIRKEGEKKPVLFNHHLPRGYICFAMAPPGSSIAFGNFTKMDYSNVKKGEPGFAKDGFNAKFDLAFYVWKKLGISFNLGYSSFAFDYQKYQELYNGTSSNYGYGFSANYYPQTYNGGNSGDRDRTWKFTHFMLGPIYSVKLGKRFTWDFKARVGPMQTVKPVIYLTYNAYSFNGTISTHDSIVYRIERSKKVDLSYNLGTSFRVALSKRLALYLSADFMNTSPSLEINTHTSGLNIPETTSHSKVQYNVSTLNLALGLAYQFKRKGNKYE